MRINLISVANETLASYRYHIQIPARELTKLGHSVRISKFPVVDADVYVFSKHYNLGDYWSVKGLKEDNRKTVFHCCDNHFMDNHGDHYRRMIYNTDQTIVTTETMASIVKMETGIEATVIPDTYEFEEKEPSFKPDGKLKLLWYGNPTNLQDFIDILPEVDSYCLGVCTDPKVIQGKSDNINFFPWSIDELRQAFSWCDAVIIPSGLGEEKVVKSHNRLVEAVRQGKFVIATGLPAYQEFAEWMYINPDGESIGVGIDWLEDQKPEEVKRRISECQKCIEQKYNPSHIGELWEKALSN